MVSLIVVCYKQAKYLKRLIAEIEAQSYTGPFELVVTDDGTPGDETLGVVQEAQSTCRFDIYYAWQRDAGFRAAAARNNGIRLARGNFLIFLDGDIHIPADFIELHLAAHPESTRRIVCGSRTYGNVITREWGEQQGFAGSCDNQWMSFLSFNFSLYRDPAVSFDENFIGWGTEDREFAFRLATRHGYEVVLAPHITGMHGLPRRSECSWNPILNPSQHTIAALIRNTLHFRSLYPNDDLNAALEFLLYFRIDPDSDEWSYQRQPQQMPIEQAVAQAEAWVVRNPIERLLDVSIQAIQSNA